jgi:A/G-specific adenine glycosylase
VPLAEPHAQVAPALLEWWRRHGRKNLPWQRDPTPYRVWISEIMLQQTQVATVERYYDRFIERFPDVSTLAAAPLDDVLHHWSGLGYYARARNLHRAAQQADQRHGGELPTDFEALVALPGIGRSTAGAILALALNQPHAILDGNAKRVIARVFGVAGWPGRSSVARELWAHAQSCTPAGQAARYTQAIMDLGATLCTRAKPRCEACPLAKLCSACAAGNQSQLPGRAPKRSRPSRSTAVLICLRGDGRVLLERRPATGIWGGLWGLPEVPLAEQAEQFCMSRLGMQPTGSETLAPVSHGFTHFDLTITPVLLHIDGRSRIAREASEQTLWYNLRKPARVGLAAPVARLLAEVGEKL